METMLALSLPLPLRQIRMARGLTQDYIAKRIGKTRQAYSRYERGGVIPNIRTGKAIADILEVRVEDIIWGPPSEGSA